jgi:hypothetical protein
VRLFVRHRVGSLRRRALSRPPGDTAFSPAYGLIDIVTDVTQLSERLCNAAFLGDGDPLV